MGARLMIGDLEGGFVEIDTLARHSAASNGFGAPEVALHDLTGDTARMAEEVGSVPNEPVRCPDFQLRTGDLLGIRTARGALRCVRRGFAWLTQAHDARDVLLAAGDCFRIDRKGLALIGAHHGATVTVAAASGNERPDIFFSAEKPIVLSPTSSEGRSAMQVQSNHDLSNTDRYARSVAASKRVRWDIDRDVIRGRSFDFTKKFLPDGLSHVDRLDFLTADEQRLLSQIQGRTYANIFGLVERFIAAKVLEVSGDHWLGDQNALEAMVRFGDEEIKHQELFRRIERMCGAGMPAGYTFALDPNAVATAVLSKSTWAVLALTCHIECFVLLHYRESIDADTSASELWKDVFHYHWREEAQHAIIDELEWRRVHENLSPEERDKGVSDLIDLVGAVDGLLQMQARADADYFLKVCGRSLSQHEAERVFAGVLAAYRWQYIVSGLKGSRFSNILGSMITAPQGDRIGMALAPIMNGVN